MNKLAISLAVLLGTSLGIQAADPVFGVQAGLAIPVGDLDSMVGSSLGLHLGGHATFDLRNGHALKPRFEYSTYSGRGITASGPLFGCDYVFHLEGRTGRGAFVGGGLGLVLWKESGHGWSDSSNTMELSMVGGYHFNREFTATVRYGTFSHEGHSDGRLVAAVEMRF